MKFIFILLQSDNVIYVQGGDDGLTEETGEGEAHGNLVYIVFIMILTSDQSF